MNSDQRIGPETTASRVLRAKRVVDWADESAHRLDASARKAHLSAAQRALTGSIRGVWALVAKRWPALADSASQSGCEREDRSFTRERVQLPDHDRETR